MANRILLLMFILNASLTRAGTISTHVTSLPSFGNVYLYHSSTSLFYYVSGTSLTANLIINAPENFEISLNYSYGYSSTIMLTPIGGNIVTTKIFVRFSPSIIGAASAQVSNTSAGSNSQNVSLSGTCIAWAIPANYYSTVNTQRNAALKTVLYNKILGHTSVSYTPGVWNAYTTTDVQPNGKIWDVYSTTFDAISPYQYTLVTQQCGNYSNEGDCYNREHSFPQSWFDELSPMKTELHHVFASDGKVNGMRSNYPFGNVSSPSFTSLYGGKLGTGSNFGYTGTVFEPIDEYKGDMARAYFYMATRYENLIAGWTTNGNSNDVLSGNAYPAYDAWHISLLQSWHNLDPVSDKEIKRNNAIYAIQNNRNPFIDSPQFVQRIWGNTFAAQPTIASTNLSITNINNNSVKLNWTSGNGQRRIVLVKAGSAVSGFPVDTFHYLANANFSLAPQTNSANYIVYNGTGSSVTITNLQAGVHYYYAVVEYNGWYSSTKYNNTNAATNSGITLPVNLLSFSGYLNHKKAVLTWQTASEKNNNRFNIERSFDGNNFETIAAVKGNQTSNSVNNYTYTDENAANEMLQSHTLFYRLKQIDNNGDYAFSKIVLIHTEPFEDAFNVSQNPFVNAIKLTLPSQIEGEFTYSITSINGKKHITKNETFNHSQQQFTINNLDDLPVGIYILQIKFNGRNIQHKIVKNN